MNINSRPRLSQSQRETAFSQSFLHPVWGLFSRVRHSGSFPQIWAIGLVLIVASLAGPVLPATAAIEIRKDLSATGGSVTMKVGDSLLVSLAESAGTGYTWIVQSCDKTLFDLKETKATKPQTGPVRAGGPVTHDFKFTAKKPGKSSLKIEFRRPWQKTAAPSKIFQLTLTVEGPTSPAPPPPTDPDPDPAPSKSLPSYSCSLLQGFDFLRDRQDRVGFLTYLKIGNLVVPADIPVKNPMSPSTTLKVVSVMANIEGNASQSYDLNIASNVSVQNKQKLATLAHQTLSNTLVEFSFDVYEFDHYAKCYFKCASTNGVKLLGNVLKESPEQLQFKISDDPGEEVSSPSNYRFELSVTPVKKDQKISVSPSKSQTIQLPWSL